MPEELFFLISKNLQVSSAAQLFHHTSPQVPSPALTSQQSKLCRKCGLRTWDEAPTNLNRAMRVRVHISSAFTKPHPVSKPRQHRQPAAALPALQRQKVPDLGDPPQSAAPEQSTPQSTAALGQSRIQRCFLPQKAASTPNPAAFPPLKPLNPPSVSRPQRPCCDAAAVVQVKKSTKWIIQHGKPLSHTLGVERRGPQSPRSPIGPRLTKLKRSKLDQNYPFFCYDILVFQLMWLGPLK